MFKLAVNVVVGAAAAGVLAQSGPFALAQRIKLGGDGGWDYLSVDSAGHRLYISRGTHMVVVDTRTNEIVGDIPDTPGVHGAVVARRHGVGFTSNGRDNSVTEFDLKTLKAIKKITVGTGPDAIIYDPATDRVFTFNGRSGDATAIDAATGNVAGTIKLDGRPEFPATDGHGHMYCNIEDKSEIQPIDPQALTAGTPWSISPCEGPSGLAIDAKDHVLFSVTDGKMAVVDANTGKMITTVNIGQGPDAAGFDPRLGYAFASCGDGTLYVVGKDSSGNWNAVQTVQTMRSARTMTLDPRTHKVYLVGAQFQAPPAGETGQRRRGQMVPGSFTLLVVDFHQ